MPDQNDPLQARATEAALFVGLVQRHLLMKHFPGGEQYSADEREALLSIDISGEHGPTPSDHMRDRDRLLGA